MSKKNLSKLAIAVSVLLGSCASYVQMTETLNLII